MMNIMEMIDLFGKDVNFKYKNHQKYKNMFGGILTIFYGIISVSIYIYYFYVYIERKESKVTYQALKFEEPPTVNLTELQYAINFNIRLDDPNTGDYVGRDELLNLFVINFSNHHNSRTIDLEKCTNYNYLNHSQNKMDDCLAVLLGENKSQMINDEGIYGVISFKDKTAFKEQFSGYNLSIDIYMKDISIRLEDYYNPLHDFIRIHKKSFNYESMINYLSFIELKYGITEVTTDYSWFFESNIEKKENINLFDIVEGYSVDYSFAICNFNFNLSYEGHSYKKSFQRLPEFLASASSLSGTIFFFFNLLSMITKNLSLEIETLNNIFYYNCNTIYRKEPSCYKTEVNSVKKKISNGNISTNSRISKAFINKKVYNLKKIGEQSIKSAKIKLKFGQCRMALLVCNICNRKRKKLYADYLLGKSILNYCLNSENYVLKMLELEYLKYLLLTKEQLNMFKLVKLDYLNSSNSEFISIITNIKENSFVSNSQRQIIENTKKNQPFKNFVRPSSPT